MELETSCPENIVPYGNRCLVNIATWEHSTLWNLTVRSRRPEGHDPDCKHQALPMLKRMLGILDSYFGTYSIENSRIKDSRTIGPFSIRLCVICICNRHRHTVDHTKIDTDSQHSLSNTENTNHISRYPARLAGWHTPKLTHTQLLKDSHPLHTFLSNSLPPCVFTAIAKSLISAFDFLVNRTPAFA